MKKTMGVVIAERRKAKGMTQLDLAQQMKVTDKAVSKWERDLSYPDINSLPQLAEVLELSLEELLQMKEAQAKPIENKIEEIVDLAFKAVALAMGVCVVVLAVLHELEMETGMSLLGISVTCLAISSLKNQK